MDPLSITASIVAIIGAGGQAAKAVRRLASLRGAPDFILALNNEITDLNLVVLAIQEIYQTRRTGVVPNQTHNTSVNNSVISALGQANQTVTELQTLYDRLNQPSTSAGGSTPFHKATWLLEQKKIRKFQEDLRNVRLKLAAVLGLLNSSTMLQVETNVHSLERRLSDLLNNQQQSSNTFEQRLIRHDTDMQRSMTQMLATQQRFQLHLSLLEATVIARAVESANGSASATTRAEPVSNGITNRSEANTFSVSIGMTAFSIHSRCRNGCTCSCHDRKSMNLRLLNRLFGSIFIGYMGLPYVTPECDDRYCADRAFPMVRTIYIFPLWLLSRALSMTLKFLPRSGPELNLRFAPIVSHASALMPLCVRGDVKGVETILRQGLGSPYDMQVDNGNTPLMYAVFYMQVGVCQILLHAGADPYQEDFAQRNTIDILWLKLLRTSGLSSELDSMRNLFHLADVPESWNLSMLHKTVLKLNTCDLASTLRSMSRQEINEQDTHGQTALFWAVLRDDASATSLLIAHGADVDVVDSRGKSPLMVAFGKETSECATLLLEAGADINIFNDCGWHTIHYCCYYGAKPFPVLEAILLSGLDVDIPINNTSGTALMLAAQMGHTQTCHFLISRSANFNKSDGLGETALHYSIESCQPDSVRLLLQYKADHRLKTKAEETLLHYTAQHSNIECLEVLCSFELDGITLEDKVIRQSPSQTSKVIGLSALEIAERRADVNPDWLEAFRKLVRSVEAANARSLGTALRTIVGDGEDEFDDALEFQSG